MELTSKQRAQLRGIANSIDTILIVGKDGIGENLIPRQRRPGCRNAELSQALPDSLGKGLPGMGNARNPILLTEELHPIPLGVGNDAHFYIRLRNSL